MQLLLLTPTCISLPQDRCGVDTDVELKEVALDDPYSPLSSCPLSLLSVRDALFLVMGF